MIIELSDKFLQMTANDWIPYRPAVEQLILAHRQGWHIFAPNRGIIQSIENNCHLSATQNDVLKYHIAEKIPMLLGQAKTADFTILCVPDQIPWQTIRQNQIPVPLTYFSDLDACNPTKLITENAAVDGRLLELLAEAVGRDLGYQTPAKLELVHGGGDTTANCYQVACNARRPSICVVDCDRKYPASKLGNTAKKVQVLDNAHKSHRAIVSFLLPVRELENAIPFSYFLEVFEGNPQVLNNISPICNYLDSTKGTHPRCQALDFVDLKKGLKRSNVAEIGPPHRDLFSGIVEHFCPGNPIDDDDLQNSAIIFQGVSEGMLTQLINHLESKRHKLRDFGRKMMKSPTWIWLEQLIRIILAFGAAPIRAPIRL